MHPFNPSGIFGFGSNAMIPVSRDEAVQLYPDARMSPRFGDRALPCWRRRAAWINTAGSFDMTWCMDARGSLIHRDAPQGTLYAWDEHRRAGPRRARHSDQPARAQSGEPSAMR